MSIFKTTTFKNPANGSLDTVGISSAFLALFFGPFYFAAKQMWRHAFAMSAMFIGCVLLEILNFVATLNGGDHGMSGADLIGWATTILYACFTPAFVRRHYLRTGWIELKSPLPSKPEAAGVLRQG